MELGLSRQGSLLLRACFVSLGVEGRAEGAFRRLAQRPGWHWVLRASTLRVSSLNCWAAPFFLQLWKEAQRANPPPWLGRLERLSGCSDRFSDLFPTAPEVAAVPALSSRQELCAGEECCSVVPGVCEQEQKGEMEEIASSPGSC